MSLDNVQLTVLMTVYNGSPFLRTAIDSILNQTYSDFHFLIVDDASTDDSREIVSSYKDPRISLVCLEHNVGQTAALNIGLLQATTPWIARMDADDYSGPTRFEEQMRALEADASILCLGTFAWVFHDDPALADGMIETPLYHQDISRVTYGSPIIHGSMIINRAAILDVGGYDERYRVIADVDLYDRLLPKYMAANLPKALLGVRRHSNQSSNSKITANEAIDLSFRRLDRSHYSAEDVLKIHAGLAHAFLTRARSSLGELRFISAFQDLIRSARVSPRNFTLSTFKIFVVYNIPERYRAKLKTLISRALSIARSRV